MKRPVETDFEVKITDSGVEVIFKPTNSHYSYMRLADKADVANFGPLSSDVRVRHAGKTGDTREYWSHEVKRMADRLAAEAAKRG